MSAGRVLVVDDEPQIRRVMRMTLAGVATKLKTHAPPKTQWTKFEIWVESKLEEGSLFRFSLPVSKREQS